VTIGGIMPDQPPATRRQPAQGPLGRAMRAGAHGLIRGYQLTLSGLIGRQCRYFPSCSEYADEAIQRHGLWAGGWMGLARICRCGPMGSSGLDLVCEELPANAGPLTPWRYGLWRGVNDPTAAQPTGSPADQRPQMKE
jgi:uncharacterized protein